MKTLISNFRVVSLFITLSACVWLIIPRLTVSFLPAEKSASLTISFSAPESSPDITEQYITSVIENSCSGISQLKKISSVSGYNRGVVTFEFEKKTNIGYKRFELSALIRQIYPLLPANTSYPLITGGEKPEAENNPLLVYSISAPFQPYRIREVVEKTIRQKLAGMQGINDVVVSGTESRQLTVKFDKDKCTALHIDPADIGVLISSAFSASYPGYTRTETGEEYFLQLTPGVYSVTDAMNIIVKTSQNTTVRLRDIASIYTEEQEASAFYRINGKNSVTMSVYTNENENKILLGEKTKQLVSKEAGLLPEGFSVYLDNDNIISLKEEVSKNFTRAIISASILFLFIIIAYRSWRNLLILASGLIASLCLTLLLSWALKVSFHLYTIAGIAISFGIITDNAIVMLDHYRRVRNRRIFTSMLGASLTTIAALSLIFFLPEKEKNGLSDFALIIILSLISSLATTLWFTPALYSLIHGSGNQMNRTGALRTNRPFRRRKYIPLRSYFMFITFLGRFRKTFLTVIILSFGIPVFLLPAHLDGNKWYHQLYNSTIGSNYYQDKLKPGAEKWLGGAFRLFVNDVYESSSYRDPEQSKLFVNAALPNGNTPEQMNTIISTVEHYLSGIKGIDKYVTQIFNGQSASVEISFRENEPGGISPIRLKTDLINKALDWGGVEWDIYGIGQGFSNAGNDITPSFRVEMRGYNFDELEKQAGLLALKLQQNNRVQKVNTNERLEYGEKKSMQFVLRLSSGQLALYHTDQYTILNKLSLSSKPVSPAANIVIDNKFYPVMIKENYADGFSSYDLLHSPLNLDSARSVKLGNAGKLELTNTTNSIHREDRQYIRVISFEYMGAPQLGRKFLNRVLDETIKEMPVGYNAVEQNWHWDPYQNKRRYILVISLLLAIFFICSVLFENLKQPFHIITIIPVSFIGLFLTFVWGGYYFDQGGYAAFVMLGGLVANAAIFIVNDFNNLRKNKPGHLYNRLLIKATAGRARTVFLTTISTCCGLIPFLLEGQNEVFWFSLAAGTIGGLLFSLFALFIVLPVLLWKKKTKPVPQRSTRTA